MININFFWHYETNRCVLSIKDSRDKPSNVLHHSNRLKRWAEEYSFVGAQNGTGCNLIKSPAYGPVRVSPRNLPSSHWGIFYGCALTENALKIFESDMFDWLSVNVTTCWQRSCNSFGVAGIYGWRWSLTIKWHTFVWPLFLPSSWQITKWETSRKKHAPLWRSRNRWIILLMLVKTGYNKNIAGLDYFV